jgi:nicotinate-nucleotide adenylyltransferase
MLAGRSACVSCARSSTSSRATDTSALEQLLAGTGILGGTFNPPHLGHLALARQARDELALDHVLLMPAHLAPHKSSEPDPGAEHRLEMCRLAVAGEPRLAVSSLELERGGASYTVDTLESIHASDPDGQLTFIVGADVARTLPAWREPARILELAGIAVAARSGSSEKDVLGTIASLGGRRDGASVAGAAPAAGEVRFLKMAPMEISSSTVRERVARGQPVEQLVGPAVAGYIAEHGLYRSSGGPSG